MPAKTAHVLWTSGWDSTFRILTALFLEGRLVRPYYVIDLDRTSFTTELETMRRIRERIRTRDAAEASRLLATRIHVLSDLPRNETTERQFERLLAQGRLGGQYEWLARFAIAAGLEELEIGVHRDDKAHKFLEGNVRRTATEPFPSYRLAEEAARTDLGLFERFRFPILDLTKRDMQEIAREHGLSPIMDMTWFCHRPLSGPTPCGTCGPCHDAMSEGMGHRLPAASRIRYHTHRAFPWRRAIGGLRRRLRRRW